MTIRLTVAQALVRFLAAQYTERDGARQRLIGATWGIFGHGNVAGLGQALIEYADVMPYHQGRNEQSMVHAAVGYARQSNRLSTHAVTTSIGPGATNLVTGAALATINHLPVLLLPGDVFATRPADPVLQQLEVPYAGDVSVNDTLRPVSKYFDRITRPEAPIPSALQAMRVLTDPVETGAVTLALPQDVQAEAFDWPEEFFRRARVDRTAAGRGPGRAGGGGPGHPRRGQAAGRRRRRSPPQRAEEALAEFASATRIPVASTQAGKGSLRYDHPQDVGGIGHTGTATADELARAADLVIGVGTRYTDFTTASGTLFQNPDVRFLNLNIAPFDGHKLAGLPLIADARSGLEELTERLGMHRPPGRRLLRPRVHRGQGALGASASTPASRPGKPTYGRPSRRSSAPWTRWWTSRTSLSTRPARSPGDLHKLWRARSADQYHLEYGYSCMGYEIPAALGVKLAAPERNVWALVGDGTYLMMPTEIVTAVQGASRSRCCWCRTTGTRPSAGCRSRWAASGSARPTASRARRGTHTGAPLPVDLAANAASLGMRVLCATTVRDLRAALAEARDADTPTCVYVETETSDTVSGAPEAQAWWDVPVAETATRPSAVKARELYERHVSTRRRHL